MVLQIFYSQQTVTQSHCHLGQCPGRLEPRLEACYASSLTSKQTFFFFLISLTYSEHQFNSVPSLSCVRLFATPQTATCQASLSITNSQSLLKLVFIESVMPSNLIFCSLFLLLPSIFPSIRVFSNESVRPTRWQNYWGFSFSISPSNEQLGLISYRIDWTSLLSKGLSRVFSNTTVQKHQFYSAQLSL